MHSFRIIHKFACASVWKTKWKKKKQQKTRISNTQDSYLGKRLCVFFRRVSFTRIGNPRLERAAKSHWLENSNSK